MDADYVEQAVAELQRTLVPHQAADWEVPAGGLDWSCRETAGHIGHDLIAYATQLAARAPDSYLPLDLVIRPEATPEDTLRIVGACAALLTVTLRAAAPDARAWHWGPTDPSGFAALGVNEILVHTYDIASGLGLDWRPPADLSAAVLRRLFPGTPSGDPGEVLLWATGRTALPGYPRRTSWSLRAAVG
ncbi:maleylpyruvate isomerase N-terminal domain-containing protein [Actinoplanes sp. DH11]|uniref:maleylpyruvate isomerase N-terminal domain-containing protein n=1 Tax=Actinoplanes sp. DH11 TaxID=2857011 RepID=UPI001E5778BA|nr:maleylpyruvate isomerase N-terminal domain-containing protein [Actinoplanes sp. DH11]